VKNLRAPGATFDLDTIGWIDFETRSNVPITAGTDRYSRSADAIILAWAVGDSSTRVDAVADFSRPLRWADMPKHFHAFHEKVRDGAAIYCAHNANFDRNIWNHATRGFPVLEPHMIVDSRVQAAASGLPAALEYAAKFSGSKYHKDPLGKLLIKLFCAPDAVATPQTHPAEWQQFLIYAGADIDAMRGLFRRTRQLPLAEWQEYWAAEQINDRGICIDLPLVEAAMHMAAADQKIAAYELSEITGRAVTTVNQVKRIVEWLFHVLPSEGRDMLVERYEEVDEETGEVTKPGKWSLTRNRVVRLLAWIDSMETLPSHLWAAQRVLQIRLYGGSKTPAKFGRMMGSHVDGVIRGQYVFNGAPQTGRFSAKGIQVHNLMRDSFGDEIDLIDALVEGITPAEFARLGDETPTSRKLSLLIRPSLIAEPDHAFVWGDWANIEARVTPWLAVDKDADKRLKVFARVDAGIEKYDVYTRTAADLSHIPLDAVDSKIRQRGKVVDLACGFGGGHNALLAMAASYGMHLEVDEAKAAVERWRDANPWAARFWGRHDERGSYGLWGAANKAIEAPDTMFKCGLIGFVYLKDYLGGSLLCQLPSGRFLTYRRIKWEMVEIVDEDTGEVEGYRRELMFSRDMGRMKLWPGLFAENVTQAAAADILRGTLVRLEALHATAGWMPTRLHTHDEILTHTAEKDAARAAAILRKTMEKGFAWTKGLPIAAETTIGRFYSKNKTSWGL
jgi:DNA polymerase